MFVNLSTSSLSPGGSPDEPALHRREGFCANTMFIPGHEKNDTDYSGDLPISQLWTVIDGFLVIAIVLGNALTIVAVRSNRRLSNVLSNQFILNLATSDLLLGLTLPYHMAFYLCGGLGHHKATCLLRFVLIALMCASSVFNLIAVAVDRYIAIVHPLHYCRFMTDCTCHLLIMSGWVIALLIGSVPIYWNTWEDAVVCELDEVLDRYYLAVVLLPAFLLIWVAMFVFYWSIWREARGQARRQPGVNDRKSIQVVLLILGCFSACWFPFFMIATLRSFDVFRTTESILIYKAAFSLAMANSGMNPLIYAWKNSEFKRTFARILRCRPADGDREPFKPTKMEAPANNNAAERGESAKCRNGRTISVPQELIVVPPDQTTVPYERNVKREETIVPFEMNVKQEEQTEM